MMNVLVFRREEKDLSLGINFYLNRYLGIKINGSYVWVGNFCNSFYQKNFFSITTASAICFLNSA